MPRSRAILRTGGLARTRLTSPVMVPPSVGLVSTTADWPACGAAAAGRPVTSAGVCGWTGSTSGALTVSGSARLDRRRGPRGAGAPLHGVGLRSRTHQRTTRRGTALRAGVVRAVVLGIVRKLAVQRLRRCIGRRRSLGRPDVSGRGIACDVVADADDGRADVDGHAFRHEQFGDGPGERGRQFDDRLGGFDLADDVVDGHGVARLDLPGDDFRLREAFADVGQVEFIQRHGVLSRRGRGPAPPGCGRCPEGSLPPPWPPGRACGSRPPG